MQDGPLKARLADTLVGLTDASQNAGWATSPDQELWKGFAKASGEALAAEGYRTRLTETLARLMCRQRFASGALATGLARRAMAQGFRGDLPVFYDKLRAADCPASSAVSPRLMRELAAAAEAARGQPPPPTAVAPQEGR
jgi:hypothetical protein